ncbi:afadin- and alpha-actinin-binding protein isoform X2 [Anopheles sinensis]|uniref:Afadin-and alpha-actinin-binding protein isoform X2 n=1 Tax=Anopheles sinensis TaxID=74873 RepID=A0A084W415_ANOSI|nr:afadin- and alpha-actinin-binding protein isoform X2 [Anopheles sinensis]
MMERRAHASDGGAWWLKHPLPMEAPGKHSVPAEAVRSGKKKPVAGRANDPLSLPLRSQMKLSQCRPGPPEASAKSVSGW